MKLLSLSFIFAELEIFYYKLQYHVFLAFNNVQDMHLITFLKLLKLNKLRCTVCVDVTSQSDFTAGAVTGSQSSAA